MYFLDKNLEHANDYSGIVFVFLRHPPCQNRRQEVQDVEEDKAAQLGMELSHTAQGKWVVRFGCFVSFVQQLLLLESISLFEKKKKRKEENVKTEKK